MNNQQLKQLRDSLDKALAKKPNKVESLLGNIESMRVNSLIESIQKIKGDKGDKGDASFVPGPQGPKGDRGDRGDIGPRGIDGVDGYSPIKGVDYFDGKDGKDGINGLDGKDGMDGLNQSAEDIKFKLESLKDEDRLDASAIKNIPKVIGLKGGGGGGVADILPGTNISVVRRGNKVTVNATSTAMGSGSSVYDEVAIDTTLTSSHDVVGVDATAGAVAITLPTANGVSGKRYSVKKIDSSVNAVTVGCTGAETIDGEATQEIEKQYNSLTVISDDTNWLII